MRVGLVVLLLLTPALVGCLAGSDDAAAPKDEGAAAKPSMALAWPSPRATAHPAYGFPTMNDPGAGLEVPLPAWWQPIEHVELPAEPATLTHRATVNDGIQRGAGIALFGSLALVPGFSEPTSIWDISDPRSPRHLSDIDAPAAQDVATIAYPDGRLVVVLAPNAASLPVVDITDPASPETLAVHNTEQFVHNLGLVPGTPIVYLANSQFGGPTGNAPGQGTGSTEIYDLSEPGEPMLVQEWENGYGCHEITFHIDPVEEKYRAYCAGIQMTQIWDIADPLAPEVLAEVPLPHGTPGTPSAGMVYGVASHLAMVNADASVLIVGDETTGTIAPTCDAHAEAAGLSASGPVGNLWFYDLSDETSPQLAGSYSPRSHLADNPPHDDRAYDTENPVPGPAGCTAHFADLVADTGLLAAGFLKGGLVLLDISDPAAPRVVDAWNDNAYVWDVWYYQGYLFTGDYDRGMDVLGLAAG